MEKNTEKRVKSIDTAPEEPFFDEKKPQNHPTVFCKNQENPHWYPPKKVEVNLGRQKHLKSTPPDGVVEKIDGQKDSSRRCGGENT